MLRVKQLSLVCLNKKLEAVILLVLTLPRVGLCFGGSNYGKNRESGWLRRFALPEKTTLTIQPTLKIPGMTFEDPIGIESQTQLAFPVEISFDKLGWPKSSLLDMITNSIYPGTGFNFLRRHKRQLSNQSKIISIQMPWDFKSYTKKVMEDEASRFDCERATLLPSIAKALDGLGGNTGRNCLQRAICEIHEDSLKGYGLLGEMILLIFSVSKSKFAETKHLQDLLEAERLGKRDNCSVYMERCKTSIFKWHRKNDRNNYNSMTH